MTATRMFKTTSVYHSKLAEASAGGLTVRFGPVKESKFKKGTFTIPMVVHGEDETYWYQIENDTIKNDLNELPRDERGDTGWLSIKAIGSRDAAFIDIADGNGNPVTATLPPTTNKPAQELWQGGPTEPDAPPPTAQPVQSARTSGDPLAGKYLAALEAAKAAVDEYRKRHGSEPSEVVRNIATTIFINQSNGRH